MTKHMPFVFDDAGRPPGKYKGDCVARAIAIVSGRPYAWVADRLNDLAKLERRSKRKKTRSDAAEGVYKNTYRRLLEGELGFRWVALVRPGQRERTSLVSGSFPQKGRFVVKVSRHLTAVVDGCIHDTHDPQRTTHYVDEQGKLLRTAERMVYGYWHK